MLISGKIKRKCSNVILIAIIVPLFLIALYLRQTSHAQYDGIPSTNTPTNIYVLDQDSNTVSVINGTTNKVIATVPVGVHPMQIFTGGFYDNFDANNNIYVTNQGSNTVSVINGTTNKVIATVPVGVHPVDIAELEPARLLTLSAYAATSGGMIPSATFILGVFEKLTQQEYDQFTNALTPNEKDELTNNPTAQNLDTFLNKLTPNNLDKFLNKVTPAVLKDISNTLTSDEFTTLLNKLSPDEHAKITTKIQSVSP